MPIHKIHNSYLVYKRQEDVGQKYQKELSAQIIDMFGLAPYEQNVITEIIRFCLNYYISRFETICKSEKSYTFYKNIFWLHEQVTEAILKELIDDTLPDEINGNYIAFYRRILKFILEMGCDLEMISDEKIDANFKNRSETILDELLFLGEMITICVDLYAEQSMIEDVVEITFDKNHLYSFSRRHHYESIFSHISKEFGLQITKPIIDPDGFPDLKNALKNCLGINYEHVSHLIASIQQELNLKHGDTIDICWDTLITNMTHLFGVPKVIAERFFTGLTLRPTNKMSLSDLACKPYNLNRFIYRPILIWKIDGNEFCVLGSSSWSESIVQLMTNAIPWGKAPNEWIENKCFQNYVHRKEDNHDKWLDDSVEEKLNFINLMYDRNVKKIKTNRSVYNIDVKGLGEIDFIIIASNINKIFIADCKHLLGRYDIVNQKNDYNAFTLGSRKKKSYNHTLSNKLKWFKENIQLLEEHFQVKYSNSHLSFHNFEVEGIFIVNSPTFYMYNSDYRIYTVNQITDVLQGKYADPTFMITIVKEEYTTIQKVEYPFFRKPTHVTYDQLSEED